MIERKKYSDRIIELLSYLKSTIELSNSMNLTDINIYSENFYRDLLNLIYGHELVNINILDQNAAAIDLGDQAKGLAIQVTATASFSKTKKTVDTFIRKELYKKYKTLIIINITSKAAHKEEFVGDACTFQLNTKTDILDITDLIKHINDQSTESIKDICLFLIKEIRLSPEKTQEKEIQTFISLISLLSDESQPSAGNGFIEEPDPERKINRRFKDHADFLQNEYQDLYIEYGLVLTDVIKHSDIGHTGFRRLGIYLKSLSDKTLSEQNGDAKVALEALVIKFKGILSTHQIEFDEIAIRFFLVDQLIRCNVFPNKEEAHA